MILPILLIVISNCFYNISTKSTSDNVNAFATLIITYLVAATVTIIIFLIMVKPENAVDEVSKFNWTSVVLGISIVGLEIGYIFAYRAGWKVSNASLVANIALACALIVIGLVMYNESIKQTDYWNCCLYCRVDFSK